jgi:hypothetical protein
VGDLLHDERRQTTSVLIRPVTVEEPTRERKARFRYVNLQEGAEAMTYSPSTGLRGLSRHGQRPNEERRTRTDFFSEPMVSFLEVY